MFKKKQKVIVDVHTPQSSIDWGPYVEGQFITKDEKQLLEDVRGTEDVIGVIEKSAGRYAELFQKILRGIHQSQVAVFVLDHLLSMFSTSSVFLTAFCKLEFAYESLLKNIYRENTSIVTACYRCLSVVFPLTKNKHQIHELIESFVLNLEKYSATHNVLSIIINCTMTVLKDKNYRRQVYTSGIINPLVLTLNNNVNRIQLCYEIAFCLWMFSYNASVSKLVFSKPKIVALLHHLLKEHTKEKIIRVVLLTFTNISKELELMKVLVSVGVFKTLGVLNKKRYEDNDVREMLEKLIDAIDAHIEEISSFNEYRQEILLGKLEWSPVHKSEKFWKENLRKFEENNYFVIRKLTEILDEHMEDIVVEVEKENGDVKKGKQVMTQVVESDLKGVKKEETKPNAPSKPSKVSEGEKKVKKTVVEVKKKKDTRSLIIALFDLGQFLVFYPRAKKLLIKFGAKSKILKLMAHPNNDVREMALKTTQKMMISKWEFL